VRGRSRALLALAVLILTGVALATPVPILAIAADGIETLRRLDEGESLTYSYRQSIYDVPVHEEFVRRGDAIELLRARSPDIRSIEYFRWDGDIVQDERGEWVENAPASEHPELVIRITTLGQQRIASPRWSVDLRERFGESVVTVRVGRRPLALAVLGGAW
jgi:hypothetical protein